LKNALMIWSVNCWCLSKGHLDTWFDDFSCLIRVNPYRNRVVSLCIAQILSGGGVILK
jgi:hypothetical protein